MDLVTNRESSQQFSGTPQPPSQRRDFSELDMLRLALDQVDYGLIVVDSDTGVVQFANAIGRDALRTTVDSGAPSADAGLRILHGRLVARNPEHTPLLVRTMAHTRLGRRGLLSLGQGSLGASVAVVPLSAPGFADLACGTGASATASTPNLALLVLAKQKLCDDSTISLYARGCGLTNAEVQVLEHVCRGMRPAEIADNQGVRISTVRTQLRSIRMKTCCDTIRELVQKVSVLPPMARHLSSPSAAFA